MMQAGMRTSEHIYSGNTNVVRYGGLGKVNEVIVFGSGKIGYEALKFLGSENISCFCDNNPQLAGSERYGKLIIPFKELREKYSDAIIIIAVDEFDSYAIAKQCEKNGIKDYLPYKLAVKLFPEYEREQMLNYLDNPANRMYMRKELFFQTAKIMESGLEYFKSHADIRYMKKAKGALRHRQLDYVKEAALFFEKISDLEIRPFLEGGCLLGYIRHGGFIPWDDDIDFMLIREEYEKLKNFCKSNLYEYKEWINREKTTLSMKDVPQGMEDYFWSEKYNYFCIIKNRSVGDSVLLEFFSLDYYDDGYDFEEFKKFAREAKYNLEMIDVYEDKIKFVERLLVENKHHVVKESNHIFFGIDNMVSMINNYPRNQFIPKEVVFPLKKILFEGEYFWVPNNAEEFVQYELFDIWEFPRDVGCQQHSTIREKDE